MLGVGGTRSNIGRKALRGGDRDNRIGGTRDPQAHKRELLRKLQEKREGKNEKREADAAGGAGT
jgi:hypothetical protein